MGAINYTLLLQLLKLSLRGYPPAMLAKAEQWIILLTIAIAAIQPQRGANLFLQLYHLFMPQAAQVNTQPPQRARCGWLSDSPAQPEGIAIDLLHQRLRRAGDQPDVGIGAGQVGGKPRMNYRKTPSHDGETSRQTPLPAASAPPRGGQRLSPTAGGSSASAPPVRSLPVRQGSPAHRHHQQQVQRQMAQQIAQKTAEHILLV